MRHFIYFGNSHFLNLDIISGIGIQVMPLAFVEKYNAITHEIKFIKFLYFKPMSFFGNGKTGYFLIPDFFQDTSPLGRPSELMNIEKSIE